MMSNYTGKEIELDEIKQYAIDMMSSDEWAALEARFRGSEKPREWKIREGLDFIKSRCMVLSRWISELEEIPK